MIRLRNGVEFEFIASAGALGFAGGGEGHGLARAWKFPWRRFFPAIPAVTKTVTLNPVAGKLTFWRPWHCVRIVGASCSSLVNAVSLTNPGLEAWVRDYYPVARARPFPVFASVAPLDAFEAAVMGDHLRRRCPGLAGLELNVSCPNCPGAGGESLGIFRALRDAAAPLPVLVKLAWQDDFVAACRALESEGAAAAHLINAVPWGLLDARPSPLASRGLEGGVSGARITALSREALLRARTRTRLPLISGGGVLTRDEAERRFEWGADAVGLGSIYLLRPWRVGRVTRRRPRGPAAQYRDRHPDLERSLP